MKDAAVKSRRIDRADHKVEGFEATAEEMFQERNMFPAKIFELSIKPKMIMEIRRSGVNFGYFVTCLEFTHTMLRGDWFL